MLQNTDLVLLLSDLQNQGTNVDDMLEEVVTSSDIPLDVLKFINSKRQLDITEFYELLRKNYNKKKSNLYINIIKEKTDLDISEILVIMSAYLLQIVLFAKHLEDNTLFLKHVRAEEISRYLNNYFSTFDILPLLKLIKLIRIDMLAFEYINGRRDLEGNIVNFK